MVDLFLAQGCAMATTVTIEIPAEREALVRRVLALQDELEQLALGAADGTVLDACETAVVAGSRDLGSRLLSEAVARRVEVAEKKGRRSAAVTAADSTRTAGRRRGNS